MLPSLFITTRNQTFPSQQRLSTPKMQLPAVSQQRSWPTPNPAHPISRGNENLVITFAVLPLSFIVVGLRIFSRTKLNRRWAVDDSLMIASLLPTIAYSILGLTWNSTIGWLHLWDYQPVHITKGLWMMLTSQLLFMVASTLIKISVLMFIHRLLINSQVMMKFLIHAMIVATLSQAVCFFFLQLFQCHTISDYWSISNEPQQCLRESHLVIASGIADTVATPIIFIFFLQSQNRLTMIVLSISLLLVALAGTLRIYYLVTAVDSWDRLWDFYPAWVAGSVQLFIGTICASLPPLEDLLNYTPLLPKVNQCPSLLSSKDDFQFMTKPTIYREIFREQHPELHTSPTPSISKEVTSPAPSHQPIPNQSDQLLLYYLQSLSEDSQLLSPILEESYVSQLSDLSPGGKRCIPSYRSSISSFNVAAHPSSYYNRAKATNIYNLGHRICVPHIPELPSSQNDLSIADNVTDSDTISECKSKDVSEHSSRASINIPSVSMNGTHDTNINSSNLNLLKLSEFEFERRTDWNRDRESILSRISEWNVYSASH
ncbi:putative integral membrane protein [Erysiphe neolycopersici]|uniref:Putative integral membrane protein n=1 Tax=Erysiphe neolycopersici TaxID=212602 RepID=A0A420HKS3_9PEZI|nr:putative integral membrane protein [Erysiphe neolycopersici]